MYLRSWFSGGLVDDIRSRFMNMEEEDTYIHHTHSEAKNQNEKFISLNNYRKCNSFDIKYAFDP